MKWQGVMLLHLAAVYCCVIDQSRPSQWSQPDASVSFIQVAALSSCEFADAGVTDPPVVHVLSDRAFNLKVSVDLKNVEQGQVRAQVEPLRAGADKLTFPLARTTEGWEGKTIITVPEEGEHAFVVRVADVEQTVRLRVITVVPDLKITVLPKPAAELWPIEVRTACGPMPLANQAISMESLPMSDTLPMTGLSTDAQGIARLTVKVAKDKLPVRVDVVSGKARKGCTLLADANSVVGDCTLQQQ